MEKEKNYLEVDNISRIWKINFRYGIKLLLQPENMRQISHDMSSEIFDNENINYEINGIEKLEKKTPYIFIANHPNKLDSEYGLFGIHPQYHIFLFEKIIKEELGNNIHTVVNYPKAKAVSKIIYKILEWAGYIIFPKNKQDKKAKEKLNNSVKKYIKNKDSILIFPEGKEQAKNTVGEFKKGIFHLSKESNAPIVPVYIEGFFGSYKNVKYTFSEPINPPKNQSPKDFVSEIRKKIFEGEFGLTFSK